MDADAEMYNEASSKVKCHLGLQSQAIFKDNVKTIEKPIGYLLLLSSVKWTATDYSRQTQLIPKLHGVNQ